MLVWIGVAAPVMVLAFAVGRGWRESMWPAVRCWPACPRKAKPRIYSLVEPRDRVHMTHRHYGIPVTKPGPISSGPARAAARSGAGGTMLVVIVLGLILYG
jgi:hypothetical protein